MTADATTAHTRRTHRVARCDSGTAPPQPSPHGHRPAHQWKPHVRVIGAAWTHRVNDMTAYRHLPQHRARLHLPRLVARQELGRERHVQSTAFLLLTQTLELPHLLRSTAASSGSRSAATGGHRPTSTQQCAATAPTHSLLLLPAQVLALLRRERRLRHRRRRSCSLYHRHTHTTRGGCASLHSAHNSSDMHGKYAPTAMTTQQQQQQHNPQQRQRR
jgi:hypothetical protein